MKQEENKVKNNSNHRVNFLSKIKMNLRPKLISIFLMQNLIPIIILIVIAMTQIFYLGANLHSIAVSDSSEALNKSAVENIERMTTDAAQKVADFLYARDADALYLAEMTQTVGADYSELEKLYKNFITKKTGKIMCRGGWKLSDDGKSWVPQNPQTVSGSSNDDRSTNPENNDPYSYGDGSFNYREPDNLNTKDVPLYNEIAYFDKETLTIQSQAIDNSLKTNYQFKKMETDEERDLSKTNDYGRYANTYVQAEDYIDKLENLKVGDIYVSDVIGAYVGSQYIGMMAPEILKAATAHPNYDLLKKMSSENDFNNFAKSQAYAGQENPKGQRFEGIVRFITPVADDDENKIGYVSLALNHDHIMELVDHITPMNERYTQLPSAYEGNYAFIWDYNCRSIAHPRHHSIVGYNPETGEPQVPWIEGVVPQSVVDDFPDKSPISIFDAWMAAGGKEWLAKSHDWISNTQLPSLMSWYKYVTGRIAEGNKIKEFDHQSRRISPAVELTKRGFVGLDGRYLNNAPQCTGWMDLGRDGGSGSFLILWSGLYKLTTAAAIPYYTGQYAPSEANDNSRVGFGVVTIGAGLEDFTQPARDTEIELLAATSKTTRTTTISIVITIIIILLFVIFIAIFVASSITGNIAGLVDGVTRFRGGERYFRFNSEAKDEFKTLADSFDDMAKSIENSIKNALSITDLDRKIIYMNEKGLEITNKTLDTIIGTSYRDASVYPPDTIYDPIDALENGRIAEVYHLQETDTYIRGDAAYLVDKDGNKTGYIIESIDVTEMVKEQIKIEEQRILLDKIFSASPDLIWYIDEKGKYITVNPRFAEVAGMPAEEMIGKTGADVLPMAIAKEFAVNDKEALKSRIPLYKEERIVFADNHEEILESVRVSIYDTAGGLVGLLGYARNVTIRVKMEEELRQTQVELEEAVHTANLASTHKGDFLARMSHEIRTPMNAIIGITNIVLKKIGESKSKTSLLKDIKKNVKQIENSSQHLLGLLNDILDISKIEAGKIELSESNMDIDELVQTVNTIISPRCKDKKIKFIIDSDDFGNTAFLGDSLRLRQVLINLLGNAVKFTNEDGVVELKIKKLDKADGKTLIGFYVRDTGIGISEEVISGIFKPFEQADRNTSAKYGGTGLGLTISHNIVHLFGGDIKVESEIGKGSMFSFEIWLPETEFEGSRIDMSEINIAGAFKGKNILLVDDVEINRMIVISLLEETGATIVEADDGLTAIDAFEKSDEGYYDIILMDVKMIHLDGYGASSRIRNLKRSDAKTVPIIALTANAYKDDIDNALKYGMNAHIAKPIEPDILIRLLIKYLK